jgi:hypothetical protein
MGDVIFLIMRRLRAPLISLIAMYAISVGGLALIPGLDAAGNPGRMSIFHAFYVTSHTATTIGSARSRNRSAMPSGSGHVHDLPVGDLVGGVRLILALAITRPSQRAGAMFVRRSLAEPFYIVRLRAERCAAGVLARPSGQSTVIVDPSQERIDG